MKHRLGAAVVASALVFSAGMLYAQPVNTTLDVQAWDDSTKEATGQAFVYVWVEEVVRHVPTTQHQLILNPFAVQPGPCRAVAVEWDIAVFANAKPSTFEKLISRSAQHNCRLAVGTTGATNPDGSQDLASVKPTK